MEAIALIESLAAPVVGSRCSSGGGKKEWIRHGIHQPPSSAPSRPARCSPGVSLPQSKKGESSGTSPPFPLDEAHPGGSLKKLLHTNLRGCATSAQSFGELSGRIIVESQNGLVGRDMKLISSHPLP
uniref:Uncharacterized protein n=1 Tax=Corvus moneduloides TaxID=1196302 RepID=A0A8C3EBS8_CORMO